MRCVTVASALQARHLGPNATTIRVNALLNALRRWLLKVPCSLQDGPTSRESSTWPMTLPYLEVFTAGCA